jgi:hypothetical protein
VESGLFHEKTQGESGLGTVKGSIRNPRVTRKEKRLPSVPTPEEFKSTIK